MKGHVDIYGRALVTVSVRLSDVAAAHQIEVWIDTGFNGDLVLPQQQIERSDDVRFPESQKVFRSPKSSVYPMDQLSRSRNGFCR